MNTANKITMIRVVPVSYTHLDVYKRQCLKNNNDNVNEPISAMLNDHQTAWIPPNFARIYADGRSMIS